MIVTHILFSIYKFTGLILKVYIFIHTVLEDFTASVGASSRFGFGNTNVDREKLFQYLPASQAELPARRMSVNFNLSSTSSRY